MSKKQWPPKDKMIRSDEKEDKKNGLKVIKKGGK